MAAFLQTNEIEVKRITVKTYIPDNDVARLMYYLYCVCTTIDCKDDADIQRFISYEKYQLLSVNERNALVVLCRNIKPEVLNDKVFFQHDALCIDFPNEFYEISQVQNQLLAAESIFIAGRTRQVNKIMAYKKEWLQYYYIDPIRRLGFSFSNSVSSAVTYKRSNTNVQPITYIQPVVVQSSRSNKGKYICCGIICIVLFIIPSIIGIIIAAVNSKK